MVGQPAGLIPQRSTATDQPRGAATLPADERDAPFFRGGGELDRARLVLDHGLQDRNLSLKARRKKKGKRSTFQGTEFLPPKEKLEWKQADRTPSH